MNKRTLQGLRADKHMSQDDLAKVVNLDRATIQRYESFKSLPNVKTAQEIANYFGMAVEDIRWF